MVSIFISYAREDREIVENLAGKLTAAGYDPFFDADITGGQAWWDQLLGEIERCDIFVPVLSALYLDSVPCRREADYALALRRLLIPVELGNLDPGSFRTEIGNAQWIPFGIDPDRQILALFRAFNLAPEAPPLPDPMPPRPDVPVSYVVAGILAALDQPELNTIQQRGVLAQIEELANEDTQNAVQLLRSFLARPNIYFQIGLDANSLLSRLSPDGTGSTEKQREYPPKDTVKVAKDSSVVTNDASPVTKDGAGWVQVKRLNSLLRIFDRPWYEDWLFLLTALSIAVGLIVSIPVQFVHQKHPLTLPPFAISLLWGFGTALFFALLALMRLRMRRWLFRRRETRRKR